MQVLSLNVGQPQEVTWQGKTVTTAIFKESVSGPLRAQRLGLEGDAQADLKVHGGPDSAVYLYPHEHYPYWRDVLSVDELPWGALGENCTVTGLLEDEVRLGDLFGVGSAEIQVTHPRLPCSKLNLRYRNPGLVGLCFETAFCGFYCSVPQEGVLEAGDEIRLLRRAAEAPTIREIFLARQDKGTDPELLRRAIAVEALPASWKAKFCARLA